mgnify:FL=1|tara:strand:- start:289 stop:1077 length:789 start_codon:yes stop_codon:yes gene_type:complete
MTTKNKDNNDLSKLIFKKPEEHYLTTIKSGLDQIENGTNEVLKGTAKIQDAIIESGIITQEMISKYSENGVMKQSRINKMSDKFLTQFINGDLKEISDTKRKAFRKSMTSALGIIKGGLQGKRKGKTITDLGKTYIDVDKLDAEAKQLIDPDDEGGVKAVGVKDLQKISSDILSIDPDTTDKDKASSLFVQGNRFISQIKKVVYADDETETTMNISELPTDMRILTTTMLNFFNKLDSAYAENDGLNKDTFKNPKAKVVNKK